MTTVILALTCQVCAQPEALTCKVTRVGEGLWVSLVSQQCPCYAYDAWNSVWAEARRLLLLKETSV